LQKHPDIAAASRLRNLYTRTGLYFEDYAIVRPLWVDDRVVLRLEKYSEDMGDLDANYDAFDAKARTLHPDITSLSEAELTEILNKREKEVYPDDEGEEEA
jgi:hypothetical protein